MTQAGNLQCKNIIHIVGQLDADNIKDIVKRVLQMCISHSHSSISFPTIVSGEPYLLYLSQVNVLCVLSILYHNCFIS